MPAAQHLIHAICLPLQLKFKGRAITQFDDAVQVLTAPGNPWRASAGVMASELSDAQRWQARVYFHPFVRRFLFDPQRSRWLQRSDIRFLRVKLPGTADVITLQVLRCQLVLFQPDIACLLLELDYTATDAQLPLQMHQLQRLLDRLRRVYPPYFCSDQNGNAYGGHCAEQVQLLDQEQQPIGEAGRYTPDSYQPSLSRVGETGSWKPGWAAHWKTLLAPLCTDSTPTDGRSIGIRQFGDDRAAIMSYVAFNDPRALNRGQWVRLCFADDHGTDPLPYAERFLQDFEAKHCYDRYWYNNTAAGERLDGTDAPTRILNCGYAFTYVGKANDGFFAHDPTGALFTFRHIYIVMGLIAHMQRAALLVASHRLTEMVARKGSEITLPDRDEVRHFYDQFVEFTQTYWFDEISPQEQGQQIFTQWRKHLRIQTLYDEVRQELRDLAEYSELRATSHLNDNIVRLGLISLTLTALAVLTGLLGMNILTVNDSAVSLNDKWINLVWGPGLAWPFASPFGLAALVGGIALLAFLWHLRSTLSQLRRWLSRRQF